jgi:hypothetical protein
VRVQIAYGDVVELDVLVAVPVSVDVEVDIDVSVDGAMPVSDVVASVVVSVVVVLWPQAASPTRQATADAARIDFNMRFS